MNIQKNKNTVINARRLQFLAFLLFLAASFSYCQKKEIQLQGTKWKLTCMVYFLDDKPVKKELKPKDCEECYTLTFDTDYTATAHSINMTLELDLRQPLCDSCFLSQILICEKYDEDGEYYCDSSDFRNGIIAFGSYSLDDDGLKLFSHKNYSSSKYLLFKPIRL